MPKGRKKSGGNSGTVYACATCFKTFPTHAQASEHEVSAHGAASKRGGLKRRLPHKAMRSCKHCSGLHTTSQHAAHGSGSHARTHPGEILKRYPFLKG